MLIVYKTTCLINGKIYVGQYSKNDSKYLGSGALILEAIKEFGKQNFIRETICECETLKELDLMEDYWIEELQATDPKIGYNIKSSQTNFILYYKENDPERYQEICEKHRQSMIGKNIWSKGNQNRKGTPASDDQKMKQSIAMIGRKQTPEQIEKRIAPIRGRKQSEDVIENRVKKLRGQKRTPEQCLKMNASHKGQVAWNKGKPWSDEIKALMSLTRKDKPWSEARRKRFDENKKQKEQERLNQIEQEIIEVK